MKLFDIIFFSGSEPSNSDPRRINDGEYHVEWHRKGIQFVRCPKGVIRKKGSTDAVAHVASGTIVPLEQFANNDYYDIVPDDGPVQRHFRIRYRDYEKWLEKNSIPNNVNMEVLLQIAEIYEHRWADHPTLEETKACMENLRQELPSGVDDDTRNSILEVWRRRMENCLIKDLLSYDDKVAAKAVAPFRRIVMQDS